MGLGDWFKKAKGMTAENKDAVTDGIENASDFADEKTDGKYTEHLDKGQEAATDSVEKLDNN